MTDAPALELLAPAGNWDCARAAVENGADAIYFGLDAGFNARARAANFALSDLPPLMEYLHLRGVRGYVTLNTLVFSSELEALNKHVAVLAQSDVDAVLVQDLGVARWLRRMCPDLELHASTQMTLTSAACLQAAEELGVRRVVLPRELSIAEIRALAGVSSLGLEAFVHGALCVAYSGQCLTSESLGGRSANRGQCAQACRLPYDLLCDGKEIDLGPVRYLLSPQDLAAYALLPQMLEAGVTAFKIEGRLKTPEYVANATRSYRAALDAAAAGQPQPLDEKAVEELELSFSRGFSPGWLQGCDHKMLAPGTSSAKRGVLIGKVTRVAGRRVEVRLTRSLAVGNGVVFEGDRLAAEEQGGRVLALYQQRRKLNEPVAQGHVELEFRAQDVDLRRLYAGQSLWKTDDPQLTRRLRATFTGPDPIRKTDLRLRVTAAVGQPLRITGVADSGACCELQSAHPLEQARRHPLRVETLREQLGRLGGTPYRLSEVQADIQGEVMAPLSVLGMLRRTMIEQLNQSLAARPKLIFASALQHFRQEIQDRGAAERMVPENGEHHRPTRLHVLCRTQEQLQAILEAGVRSAYAEYQDIRQYREAIQVARQAGAQLFIATPRIEKPGETGVFRSIAKQKPDGVLARNLGGLRFFTEQSLPVVADFSLNASNELTVDVLCDWGAIRVTASYDLNRDQILDLVAAAPAHWLEVVIHQHMPMFHMEHCVFCAVLSPGTNKTNCGRPCDNHQVKLRDRIGMEHPLHADVGCRNTLYNATPQSSAEVALLLAQQGVLDFRIELLEHGAREATTIVDTYQQLLDGRLSGREVWRKLQASNRVGVTRGSMEERRDPLALI